MSVICFLQIGIQNLHPPMSQEKHFKVLTEVMTEMFLQCGLLIEADIIEMDNYQDFLKVLHHHSVMGNISTTQVTHFIMLMVYMSFCRPKHYTEYIGDRNGELLKSSIWMSLLIISFRTTFSMKGGHQIINPYFKDLPSVVRRNLHVAVIRYMEQECTCQNHVQCDIYPTTLTSEVVLPSYQHFLQQIHQTGTTKKVSNESDVLSQYGKTIQMLILARVNRYYSPYSPQTIMEEEAKALYRDVFTLAEREFFKHRLLTLYPKLSEKGVETSISFLEQQKQATAHVLFIQNKEDMNGLSLEDSQTELIVIVRTYQKWKMIQLRMRISSVWKLMRLPFQQMILNTTPVLWTRSKMPLMLLLL